MTLDKATFAAGCFWGVEARFAALPGVLDTAVGYAGGAAPDPSYKQVCGGDTGHAEAVELTYDPDRTSYAQLLDAFFAMHNPEQPYLQADGKDRSQYRSAIFTHSDAQAREATARVAALRAAGVPAGTSIEPALTFWRAEESHQRYYEKRNITP